MRYSFTKVVGSGPSCRAGACAALPAGGREVKVAACCRLQVVGGRHSINLHVEIPTLWLCCFTCEQCPCTCAEDMQSQ